MSWEVWVIALLASLSTLLAVGMIVLALPGIWLMFVVAGACLLWQSHIITPTTFITIGIIGIVAELIEFFASAVGVKKLGGSKRGALGAIIGTIVGAILGGVFLSVIPVIGWVIGPILGGILGAGAGALMVERSIVRMSWRDSMRSGGGAAIGRTVSIFVKMGLAIVAGIVFLTAAFV